MSEALKAKHPLAHFDGITLVTGLLAYTGRLCPECGHGTRATSKNWAKCKKCGTRVKRNPLPSQEQ